MEECILLPLKLQEKLLPFDIVKLSSLEISLLLSKASTSYFVLDFISWTAHSCYSGNSYRPLLHHYSFSQYLIFPVKPANILLMQNSRPVWGISDRSLKLLNLFVKNFSLALESKSIEILFVVVVVAVYLFIFERERERVYARARGREKGRQNPKQALRCQRRARCGTRTHKP